MNIHQILQKAQAINALRAGKVKLLNKLHPGLTEKVLLPFRPDYEVYVMLFLMFCCLHLKYFAQNTDTLRFPEVPSEYMYYKSFEIGKSRKVTISIDLKQDHLYAFHFVCTEGTFVPRQSLYYTSEKQNKSKKKQHIKGGHNLFRYLKPIPHLCKEAGKHIVEINSENCYQAVYLHIYEADYSQANQQTIYTLVSQPPNHIILEQPVYYLYKVLQLQYPKEAKEKKIEGIVSVECVVNVDGSVSDLRITDSLGYGCDEEALRLVRKTNNWRPACIYDPVEKEKYLNGQRLGKVRFVRQRIVVKIYFKSGITD